MYLKGKAIHEFKIPTKYLYTLVILHIIWNPWIYEFTYMSNFVKPLNFMPTKFNDFTVFVSCPRNSMTSHYLCHDHEIQWFHSICVIPMKFNVFTVVVSCLRNSLTLQYLCHTHEIQWLHSIFVMSTKFNDFTVFVSCPPKFNDFTVFVSNPRNSMISQYLWTVPYTLVWTPPL